MVSIAIMDGDTKQTLTAILLQLQSHDERLGALEASANQNQHQSALSIKGHDNETHNVNSNNNNSSNEDDSRDVLTEDTFTLMMLSRFRSQAWLLGLFTFAFQTVLSVMIATDQLKESIGSSTFNVPFKVDPVVRVGQLFAIVYFMATQSDITSSVRFLVMFWKDPHWDRIILGRVGQANEKVSAVSETLPSTEEAWVEDTTVFPDQDKQKDVPSRTNGATWTTSILVPNVLRFVQGIIVNFISFVIIVQSDNIIDLLKDFTALMILSETDNIFFGLAAKGYFGRNLQRTSIQARKVEIKYEASSSLDLFDTEKNPTVNDAAPSGPTGSGFFVRPFVLFCLTMIMTGSWAYIVMNQINGVYFDQRYPDCKRTVPNTYQLATDHFGDGVCYGGPLNTLECQFEDGDCINFNIAYPLCKGNDRINAEESVGDGKCDAVFMNSDCNYDGGDCCDYINDPSFGNGFCDEEMNSEGCGYDNGDCIDYNRDFAGCPFDIMYNNTSFGDGQCNGGISSTGQCGYDNGDCNQLRIAHPDCPLDSLSQISGSHNFILGDGICDGNTYNVKECGFEYGDCKQGQVGQSILIPDGVQAVGFLYFSKVLSLDRSTLALGLYFTDEDGRFSTATQGFVNVWRFNGDKKLWLRLGDTIQSPSGKSEDLFGYHMSMSDSGNHLAISSTSGLNVFELNDISGTSNEEWIQVGQILNTTSKMSIGIISSDGSRVALIYDSTEIYIYNLETIPDGQTWMHDDDLDVIKVDEINRVNTVELRFAPSDDSTLLFSNFDRALVKIFRQTNPDDAWRQIGQDIGKAPSSSSLAIALNGNRIGVHKHSNDTSSGSSNSGQDEVQVLDYNGTQWLPVGSPIVSSSLNDGQEFGYSVDMSVDGNLLLIGLNHPGCRYIPNRFDVEKCTKSSGVLFELYTYHPENNRFMPTLSRKNVKDTKEVSDGSILHGLHFSLGNGDNGSTLLSVSNYNIDDEVVFVDVIDLDELYYTKCVVNEPELIGDGTCADFPPYNTEACGFDGGDCERKPVDGYPNCFVHYTHYIGDGECDDHPPYNTEACGFDGGDCGERNPVDGYPDCFVTFPAAIGDGECYPPYNTAECGFDGGDCLIDGYPNCVVNEPDYIGDGFCDDFPPYNTETCGFDGGDCL